MPRYKVTIREDGSGCSMDVFVEARDGGMALAFVESLMPYAARCGCLEWGAVRDDPVGTHNQD